MCFKQPKAAADTTPKYVAPAATQSTGAGDGVTVKGGGKSVVRGGVTVDDGEAAQRSRRRSASQGLGL